MVEQKTYLKEHSSVLIKLLHFLDVLLLGITGWISYYFVFEEIYLPQSYQNGIFFAMMTSIPVYANCKLYRAWRGSSEKDELITILGAYLTLFACLIVTAFLLKVSINFSRTWVGTWFLFGLFVWSLVRMIARYFLRQIRRKGFNQRHIILIGSINSSNKILSLLKKASWAGLKVDGIFLGDNEKDTKNIRSIPILGKIKDIKLSEAIQNAEQIWIAMPLDDDKIKFIMSELDTVTADIRLVPNWYDFPLLNHSVTVINGLPILNVSMSPMDGFSRIAKSIEDKVLSILILILISPILLILAIAVKLTSKGPILYKQERVGWNGRPFLMYKFRSMPVGTESKSVEWGNASSKSTTSFGKFIRKTSLDELPQFWNVFKGEMSVVGPRPERPQFVDNFKHEVSGYMKKHKVKAGITGWAQINGWRGDTNLSSRIKHDLWYIDNWSLILDLKIIILTLMKGFTDKNAV